MNFFKTFLATTLGTIVALFIICLIAIITVISSSGEPEPYVRDNSVLNIEISGELLTKTSQNPFDELFNQNNNKVSVENLKENLTKAAAHDNVKGVLLDIDIVNGGWADLEEAHRAIAAFRDSSDKFIYANTNDLGYNEKGYFLASAADSVFSPSESFFEFDGFVSQVTFFTGLFEKLGVEAEITRYGKYKSAVEPYFEKDLSEESEYQLTELLNTTSSTFIDAVEKKSGRSADELNSLMNEQPRLTAKFGYEEELIDSLLYKDELESHIKKRMGAEDDDELRFVSHNRYTKVSPSSAGVESPDTDQKIAVIHANGAIMPESNESSPFGGEDVITADFFEEQLDDIRNDDNVKALVVRVNSPGGAGSTSDLIWRMLQETKEDIPVIVSMGPVAASGGYYIAMGADTILAENTTITGSIGVFATKFNAQQLFNEELGITFDEVKTHEHADWLYPTRGLSESESKAFQGYVDEFYDSFITKVASSRDMNKDAVDEVAQGRVWSGKDALEQQLVDEIGGLDEALDIAAEKAEIEDYTVTSYPRQKDIYELLMGGAQAKMKSLMTNTFFEDEKIESARQRFEMMKQRGVLTLFPYDVSIQ